MAYPTPEQLHKALVQLQRECELRWYIMDASRAPSNWSREELSFRGLVVSMSKLINELQASASFEAVLDLSSEDNTVLKIHYIQACEFWAITESRDDVQKLLDQYRVSPVADDGSNWGSRLLSGWSLVRIQPGVLRCSAIASAIQAGIANLLNSLRPGKAGRLP